MNLQVVLARARVPFVVERNDRVGKGAKPLKPSEPDSDPQCDDLY